MRRRLGLLLLLPVVWLPILCMLLLAIPAVPWWAWLFGVVFWVFLLRRVRGGGADVAPAEGGVAWSPTRRSGGLW